MDSATLMTAIIYPGTFDPITHGHVDLVTRASKLFDRVIIAVAQSDKKQPLFNLEDRIALCKKSFANLQGIEYVSFSGLTIDLAKRLDCYTFLRGVRAVADYEYELQLARMNRAMNPKVDTIFLTPGEGLSHVSSSLLREVASMGGDVSRFVPPHVLEALNGKFVKKS